MPTITAVIPTYNRSKTIGRALGSVFAQTRPPEEVIVIDDASTDDTIEVIKQFPIVKLLRTETNQGAAHARNVGIQQAKGDYIAFLDSDDLWHRNKLELQEQYLNENPDTILTVCGVTVHKREEATRYIPCPTSPPESGWSFDELQTHAFSTPTWLARRTALFDAGLFDESLPNREDLDLLAKLLAVGQINGINEPLLIKHTGDDSLDADSSRLLVSVSTLLERHETIWQRSTKTAILNYRHLARIHFQQGDMKQGRLVLRQALKLSKPDPVLYSAYLLSYLGKNCYLALQRYFGN